jgi:endonuclease/exonuclease/phosphatase family metal-dependent hydrolase
MIATKQANTANTLAKGMRGCFIWFILLSSCWAGANSAFADVGDSKLRVMTQNLYDGTDRTGLLQATSFAEFLAAVDFAYNNMKATKPAERLTAVAHEIAANKADVVGLQEAAIWRTGPSSIPTPAPPAEDVQVDYLTILLEKLRTLGQTYIAAAVLPGLDVQLPSNLGFDVRLTDRDVIIVRKDLLDRGCQVTNLQEKDYLSQKVYPVSLLNAQVAERAGWVSFDLSCGGLATRIVSTHLAVDENFNPATATAQANELLLTAGRSNLPTVFLGDFNSDANHSDRTFQTYQTILDGGFKDAWNLIHGSAAGLTCCQDENLGNSRSKLTVRYDLVFVKGLSALDAKVVGDKSTDKTPSGLWPSDHAGVIATLR